MPANAIHANCLYALCCYAENGTRATDEALEFLYPLPKPEHLAALQLIHTSSPWRFLCSFLLLAVFIVLQVPLHNASHEPSVVGSPRLLLPPNWFSAIRSAVAVSQSREFRDGNIRGDASWKAQLAQKTAYLTFAHKPIDFPSQETKGSKARFRFANGPDMLDRMLGIVAYLEAGVGGDGPRCWAQILNQHLDEGRLTGAVEPEDTDAVTHTYCQVDFTDSQGLAWTVAIGGIIERQQRSWKSQVWGLW
ncbi:uncharacterized protein UV8b_04402 [Ustilaginoidea virens]|uniref:Uncharacterized protein n=1 Tax=Ustilaginoidea virens TaxID=1159556 RepID=A0A8E5MHP7_USTVR|nr:uncharacterized protein UV8b_04402 [Ustilaginoidea virens]QUC20161.1 hypothetical protein UV8b_04402 [Ustilaginoidea virens]